MARSWAEFQVRNPRPSQSHFLGLGGEVYRDSKSGCRSSRVGEGGGASLSSRLDAKKHALAKGFFEDL